MLTEHFKISVTKNINKLIQCQINYEINSIVFI